MISRQLSGLETILRRCASGGSAPGFLLARFRDPAGGPGFFMCRAQESQVDSKGRAGPKVRHTLCNYYLPPTRPHFRLAGIARKDTCASGPLVPLELPGEEMPGCLGALTLDYYHCNKEPGQHPRYFLLFPLFSSLCARCA